MSKIYRRIDCGKEFEFDYIDNNTSGTEEEKTKNIESNNIPREINICFDCLKVVKTNEEESNDSQNKKNNIFQIDENTMIKLKDDLIKNANQAKKEKKKLKEELNELKQTYEKNEKELKNLLQELENVEKEETAFCNEFRETESKIYFLEKEIVISNDLKIDYETKTKYLNNYNIFNELFQISFEEKYGSINECKFCDPSINGNYDNINAGWGYIILLTKLLSIKYMFESKNYILVPEGNFSSIIDKANNNEKHEIGLSDMNRTRDKFNKAMSLYVYYLKEFIDFLFDKGKIDSHLKTKIPNINGNKINDYSIEIENSKEKFEGWYLCMKFLLNILKILICQLLNEENHSLKDY